MRVSSWRKKLFETSVTCPFLGQSPRKSTFPIAAMAQPLTCCFKFQGPCSSSWDVLGFSHEGMLLLPGGAWHYLPASDDSPSGLGELRITGLLPSITVPEGGTAQLHCTVTGNNVNIRWSRWAKMRWNFPFFLFPNIIIYPPNTNAGCLPGVAETTVISSNYYHLPFLKTTWMLPKNPGQDPCGGHQVHIPTK